MSAAVGRLVATVSEVLADLSGAIGDKVRRELPDYDLVRCIWKKSGERFPILTSCGASGTASGTSAMCMGFQRRPWRT